MKAIWGCTGHESMSTVRVPLLADPPLGSDTDEVEDDQHKGENRRRDPEPDQQADPQ